MTDHYEECEAQFGEDASAKDLLRCVVESMNANQDAVTNSDADTFARSFLLIYAASLIFLMQAGFAMVAAGSVRSKNVGNTMLKNLLDACGAAVAFFAVGYGLAYGGSSETDETTFIGTSGFFLIGVDDLAHWLFEYSFSAASTTIVAGALAERCQMASYLCYSFVLVAWVYPVVVHSIWSENGFLSALNSTPFLGIGMIDFAGSGVVHLTGGLTAYIAAKILGPRRGRFHDDHGRALDKPRDIPGHSVALVLLGCFILWFGWYGFNTGSALVLNIEESGKVAELAAVNTALSAGTGGISALFLNLFILERSTGESFFDLNFAVNGVLCGAVAVTAGCAVFEPWAAVVVGFVAGTVYIYGHYAILRWKIDDVVDAIPVHFMGGLWGVLAVGLFASPPQLERVYGQSDHVGCFYSWARGSSDATLLAAQLVGTIFIIGWVSIHMLPFFLWLDWRGWLRSDPMEEIVGLDTSYHGGTILGEDVHPEYITNSVCSSVASKEASHGESKESVCREERPKTIFTENFDVAETHSEYTDNHELANNL